ncbi:MAG: leucine-rich repeat protein [Clostridia bacterium]|nr:leucine-rich repeat protein [Clostridia bacterium]
MKKLVSTLLVVLLCATCFAVAMVPASADSSGSCGAGVNWTLDNQGNLTITGAGPMKNYSSSNRSPFFGSTAIKDVWIGEGVTTVGSQAFGKCSNLVSIHIPSSVTSINQYAFWFCEKLERLSVGQNCKLIDSYACANCTSLKSVSLWAGTRVADNAFTVCNQIEHVWFYGTPTEWNNLNVGANNTGFRSVTPDYQVQVIYVADTGGFVDGDKTKVIATVGRGEIMEVSATPADGYRFVGWYNGDTMVSDAATYDLFPTENLTLTAKFEKVEPIVEPAPYCPWCGGHHDNAGLIEMLIGWFHGILALLLGARY